MNKPHFCCRCGRCNRYAPVHVEISHRMAAPLYANLVLLRRFLQVQLMDVRHSAGGLMLTDRVVKRSCFKVVPFL